MSSTNPLLTLSNLPNHAPAFDKIKEEHFIPATEAAIAEARKNIDAIKNTKDAPDFDNTIIALENASETLGQVTSIFYNQLSANGTDGLQDLAEKIGPITSNFSNDIMHDADIFARVKAVHDQKNSLDLTPEQAMLLDESYKGFIRSGANLDTAKKQRLREISERTSVLGPTFMNNVKKSTEAFTLIIDDEQDLSGLPDGAIQSAKETATGMDMPEKWVFTLDIPSYLPFMQFADNRDLRKKMWMSFSSRAWNDDFDNSPLILEVLKLRAEKAKILGYTNHAEFVLEKRMAEKPENVLSFLDKLQSVYKSAAQKDLDNLKAFAAKTGGPDDIQPWDIAYYAEKLKQDLFDFSSEDLRPYFPLDYVLKGVFTHFTKLFQLRFEENKTYEVWHKDVKAFDVFDTNDDRFIGTLFADFHPREGKKNGAWKTAYRSQGLFNGNIERPVIAIVCNFTKPTADKPSLLTHGEVTTLFHEMGHAIHGLLSDVTYRSLSGTSVLWDFVELPSQVQENWAYTKETLDLFAAHYKTGDKIPKPLIEKLNAAKNFMGGWAGLRQVSFSSLDMAWHMTDPDDIKDVAAFEDEHTKDTTLFPRLSGPFSCAFSHIFAGGYSAGYYSYKWAEVLDADTFELFQKRGLYDKDTADAFKREVLSKGGTEHPSVLYKRFRGRDADPDAVLRREGIISTDKTKDKERIA